MSIKTKKVNWASAQYDLEPAFMPAFFIRRKRNRHCWVRPCVSVIPERWVRVLSGVVLMKRDRGIERQHSSAVSRGPLPFLLLDFTTWREKVAQPFCKGSVAKWTGYIE